MTNRITYLECIHLAEICFIGNVHIFRNSQVILYNVYVLYIGGPNFSNFTTVIVMNFEADYLCNCWTWKSTGLHKFIIFYFKQLLLLAQIDLTHCYKVREPPKKLISKLFQIVLGSDSDSLFGQS
jgi:hypothetical protein